MNFFCRKYFESFFNLLRQSQKKCFQILFPAVLGVVVVGCSAVGGAGVGVGAVLVIVVAIDGAAFIAVSVVGGGGVDVSTAVAVVVGC